MLTIAVAILVGWAPLSGPADAAIRPALGLPGLVTVTISGSQVYGSTPVYTTQVTLPLGISLSGAPVCTSVLGGKSIVPTLPVGGYTIDATTCSGLSLTGVLAGNFVLSLVGGTFNVSKALLTVTPANQSRVYGVADPAFGFGLTGLVNGEAGSVLSAQPTCGVSGAHANVGTYTIGCSAGTAANYLFDVTRTATLTVTKALLSVAVSGSQTYGSAPTYTPRVTLPSGVQLSGSPQCTNVLGGNAITPTLPAGAYTIDAATCSGLSLAGTLAGDFALSLVGDAFNVAKAPLTVTPANQTRLYGAADPAFGFNVTGFVNGEGTSVLGAQPTCGVSGAHTNAGTYAISCTGGTATNYLFDLTRTATLTVTQALLGVAISGSQTYGSTPAYTPQATLPAGVQLSGTPHCTNVLGGSAIAPTLPAGAYTVDAATCSGLSLAGALAGNFVLSLTGDAFNVAKAPLTVTPANQSRVYGAADPAFGFDLSGLVNGETTSVLNTQPACGVNGAHTNPGTYTITCAAGSAVNYLFDLTHTATLTVAKALLTVTPADQSRVYGEADPTFAFDLAGFVNGETASVLGALPTCGVTGAHTNAGTYTITCLGGLAANYLLDVTRTATLTVQKAVATLAWSTPAAIPAGLPLTATELSATALGIDGQLLSGLFTYTPGLGTVLPEGVGQLLTAHFTPTDLVNYVLGTVTTTITILPPAVTLLTVSPSTASIAKGTTQQFSAIATLTDSTFVDLTPAVTWSSSNPTVTIDASGLATGAQPGTADITAALGPISAHSTLTITPAVLTSLDVSTSLSSVARRTTTRARAIGHFSDGTTQDIAMAAQWTSSKPKVAKIVGRTGIAKGLSAGTTTLTATFGGVVRTTTLTVTNAAPTAITIAPAAVTISRGTTRQLTATATFSDGSVQDITADAKWTTSSKPVAAVGNAGNNKGTVTARHTGSATITATFGGVTATRDVTVL
ncbi:MAG: hypothetical protein JWL83_1900 [Actinomycetia bacterium]|nr:hypothetical protein [Actinomycetes bacterium]